MKQDKLFVPFSTAYKIVVTENNSRFKSRVIKTAECGCFESAEIIACGQIMELMEKYAITNDKLNFYQKVNLQGVSMSVKNEDETDTWFYVEIHRI